MQDHQFDKFCHLIDQQRYSDFDDDASPIPLTTLRPNTLRPTTRRTRSTNSISQEATSNLFSSIYTTEIPNIEIMVKDSNLTVTTDLKYNTDLKTYSAKEKKVIYFNSNKNSFLVFIQFSTNAPPAPLNLIFNKSNQQFEVIEGVRNLLHTQGKTQQLESYIKDINDNFASKYQEIQREIKAYTDKTSAPKTTWFWYLAPQVATVALAVTLIEYYRNPIYKYGLGIGAIGAAGIAAKNYWFNKPIFSTHDESARRIDELEKALAESQQNIERLTQQLSAKEIAPVVPAPVVNESKPKSKTLETILQVSGTFAGVFVAYASSAWTLPLLTAYLPYFVASIVLAISGATLGFGVTRGLLYGRRFFATSAASNTGNVEIITSEEYPMCLSSNNIS